MTPERMAALVARWARFYTRDLPAPLAERRVGEIDADLHDHIAHERGDGIGERRIAFGIASRMARGLAADVAWRRRHSRSSTVEVLMKTSKVLARSAARVAVGVALILAVPLVAMQLSGDVVWSLADFVGAALFLTVIGVAIELAMRRTGNVGVAIGLAALGVLAAVFGESDDAPGLVLMGLVLIATACAIGVRTAQRSR
jgi:ribosomal protein L13E